MPLADAGLSLLADPTLRTVALGTAGVGAVGGMVGTFAVVRRQSLQGDAVSHAALPGVAVAFLLGGRSTAALMLGGAAAGWVAMALVGGIVRRTRTPFDAALGGTLAVFFGVGLAALSYMQRHVLGAAGYGPERYLFGQAATLQAADLWAVGAVALFAGATLVLLWRPFELLAFDPEYAATLGLPVRRLDLLLTGLVVLAVVVGLQAVGVVLMSSLLVAPAAAARQWTDRLAPLAILAGLIGAASGLAGTVVSHVLSEPRAPVPPGPAVVLCATAAVILSLLFAPRRGLVWGLAR
jgi:manganese/zinc/iron transport system permease protein